MNLARTLSRAVVTLTLLAPSLALAEPSAADRETARALVEEADRKTEAKDLTGALRAFQGAHAIMGVPTTGIEVAKAQVALGLLLEARETALAVSRIPTKPDEPDVFRAARNEAERLAAALLKRVPSLSVTIEGVGPETQVEVKIDGAAIPPAARELPRKLNPGKHSVVVTAPGFQTDTSEVLLSEGDNRRVTLVLRRADQASVARRDTPPTTSSASQAGAPSSTSTMLVYGGFGLASLGFAVGTVTGVMSLSKASSAKSQCDGNICPLEAKADADSSKSLANASNVSFGLALIGAGVGLYGLFAYPGREAPKQSMTPLIGPGSVGVRGSF